MFTKITMGTERERFSCIVPFVCFVPFASKA
jgi:hypothetical protein